MANFIAQRDTLFENTEVFQITERMTIKSRIKSQLNLLSTFQYKKLKNNCTLPHIKKVSKTPRDT